MNAKDFDRKSERRSRFDRKKKFKKISSSTKLKETKRKQNSNKGDPNDRFCL